MLEVKRPVDVKHKISSPFGKRILDGKEVDHKGIDFATPVETIVKSMVNGVIFVCGFEDESNKKKGLGLRVWQEFLDIPSGKTFYCWYGHLSQIYVEPGQFMQIGQPIGLSGNTGHSTGPHLHVQFRQKNTGEMVDAKFI